MTAAWLLARWRVALAFLLVLAFCGLLLTAAGYRDSALLMEKDRDAAIQQRKSAEAVTANVIATLVLFNDIATATADRGAQTDSASQARVVQYRTVLRREKSCDLPVPDAVARGLLGYADRLRAGGVHAASGLADAAGAGTPAAGALTYCRAVLWIDPLLAALDKANTQLAAIRQAEQKRQEVK